MKHLATTLALLFASQSFPLVDKRSKNIEPKNKYNLSEQQIEILKSMSAKDKKKFIKGIQQCTKITGL